MAVREIAINTYLTADQRRLLDTALRERENALERQLDLHCKQAIPFARLSIEPQALRCVTCESIHERTY